MSDTCQTPYDALDVIVEEGEPAEKAFREQVGVGVTVLADSTLIPVARP